MSTDRNGNSNSLNRISGGEKSNGRYDEHREYSMYMYCLYMFSREVYALSRVTLYDTCTVTCTCTSILMMRERE